MTGVPLMPLNVDEFFGSPEVDDMDGEQAAMWLLLIAESWRRKTLLPADDRKLARALGIDVRIWKRRYKPVFLPLMLREKSGTVSGTVSDFYRIAKVNAVWDTVAKRIADNKEEMARLRAAKAAKHGKRPSVPEPEKPSDAEHVSEPVTASVAEPVATSNQNQKKDKALLPNSREPYPSAPTVEVAALPPRANGSAGGSADVGSPGLGGRSPPQPSEKIEVTAALLATPLVKKARSGLMAALDDDED